MAAGASSEAWTPAGEDDDRAGARRVAHRWRRCRARLVAARFARVSRARGDPGGGGLGEHRSGVTPGQLGLDRDPWAEGVGEVLHLLVGAGLGRRAFGIRLGSGTPATTGITAPVQSAQPHGPSTASSDSAVAFHAAPMRLGASLEVPLAGGDRHDEQGAVNSTSAAGVMLAAHRPFDRGSMAACEYQEVGVVDHRSVVQTAQQRGRADHVDVHGGGARRRCRAAVRDRAAPCAAASRASGGARDPAPPARARVGPGLASGRASQSARASARRGRLAPAGRHQESSVALPLHLEVAKTTLCP